MSVSDFRIYYELLRVVLNSIIIIIREKYEYARNELGSLRRRSPLLKISEYEIIWLLRRLI